MLVSGVQKKLYEYIYPLFFRFFSHIGHYRVPLNTLRWSSLLLFVLFQVQGPTIAHYFISAYCMHFSFPPEFATFDIECTRVKGNIKGIKND